MWIYFFFAGAQLSLSVQHTFCVFLYVRTLHPNLPWSERLIHRKSRSSIQPSGKWFASTIQHFGFSNRMSKQCAPLATVHDARNNSKIIIFFETVWSACSREIGSLFRCHSLWQRESLRKEFNVLKKAVSEFCSFKSLPHQTCPAASSRMDLRTGLLWGLCFSLWISKFWTRRASTCGSNWYGWLFFSS